MTGDQQSLSPSYKSCPLVNMSIKKANFYECAYKRCIERVMKKYSDEDLLYKLILRVTDCELNIIVEEKKWQNTPREKFWNNIKNQLSTTEKNKEALKNIISQIIFHYLDEITGNFSPYHYNLAKKCVAYTLCKLLCPITIENITGFKDAQTELHERIFIHGDIEKIRQLASQGVLILLPTHFSNLDSAVISWVTESMGLPPFIYGAGVNLFNKKFWNYTLSKIGTYKVDRARKNPLYLSTLDSYASESIVWGGHSLFYPHGTRSRSGAIEDSVKRGLLTSALYAQENMYKEKGIYAEKIFFIPVTINYPFVFESSIFAKSCLANFLEISETEFEDKNHVESFNLYKKILKAANILTKESTLSVRFGEAMDVLGNKVNHMGESFLPNGDFTAIHDLIAKNENNYYLSDSHIKHICSKIVSEQRKCTTIMICQIIAYAMVHIITKLKHTETFPKNQDIDKKTIIIPKSELQIIFKVILKASHHIEQINQGFLEKYPSSTPIEELMVIAAKQLAPYEIKRPILCTSNGDFTTQNLGSLIYYSNRISHYQSIFDKYLENNMIEII